MASEYLLFASSSILSTRKGEVQDGTLGNDMIKLCTDENIDDRKSRVLGSNSLAKLEKELGLAIEVARDAEEEDIPKIFYLPGVKYLKLHQCSLAKDGTLKATINSFPSL